MYKRQILDGSSQEQLVDKEWYTEWTFYVTPLVAGQHTLLLKLSEIKLVNKKERKRDITFTEIVTVVAKEALKPTVAAVTKPTFVIATFDDLKVYLKNLIQVDLELALRSYEKVMSTGAKNEITLQLGSFNGAKNEYLGGRSTSEERNRTFAHIRYALTQMIDDLEEKDVVSNYASILNG